MSFQPVPSYRAEGQEHRPARHRVASSTPRLPPGALGKSQVGCSGAGEKPCQTAPSVSQLQDDSSLALPRRLLAVGRAGTGMHTRMHFCTHAAHKCTVTAPRCQSPSSQQVEGLGFGDPTDSGLALPLLHSGLVSALGSCQGHPGWGRV